jgi:hypothetical protein
LRNVTTWHKSLKSGDLAIAYNAASKRRHIIQLRRCGAEYDSRQGEPDGHGGTLDYSGCWDGRSLCGVDTTHATFGNRKSYYWQPSPEPITTYTANDVRLCEKCRSAWRADGELTIRSDVEHVIALDYPPPFGWHEVPAIGHPWDVPPGGDPETIKDATGKVQGQQRIEIRRWQRGHRVVRLMHYYAEGYDAAHYHDARRPLEDTWREKMNPDAARRKAQEYMARGGD